jgi:replicative DNA helicase
MAASITGAIVQSIDADQIIRLRLLKLFTDLPARLDRTPPADLIRTVQAELQTIDAGEAAPTHSAADLLDQVVAEVAHRRSIVRETGGPIGVPTGIGRLDRALGGLQAGLHLLAAEPGQGKTTLALQIGRAAAARRLPVLFVSLEESKKRLTLKALCAAAGLETKRFWDGYGEPATLAAAAAEHHAKLAPLHITETVLTVGGIRASAEACRAKLVIVDYLQLLAARIDAPDMRAATDQVTADLRQLSRTLDVPVLAVSSQNRGGQGTSNLTSLKESSGLEYSADSVSMLVKDDARSLLKPLRAVKLAIRKNRHGDTDEIPLVYRPHLGDMYEDNDR